MLRINALQSWRRLLAVRNQSRLLTGIIALFIAGYLVVSFGLFYHGLRFIAKFPGLGAVLTERLMYVLFAFLFALLLLSNLIISYTNFFRNRETTFLLTLPVPAQTIFRWKFIESTVLASWAFVFLIAPLLAAFGLLRGVAWHFYPVTLVLIALFIVLPGVLGAVAGHLDGEIPGPAQFPARHGRNRAVVLLAVAAFWWKAQPVNDELLDKRTLRGARPTARQDAVHHVSVSAQLLAVGVRAAMGRGHSARRGVFRAGAVEPHAVLSAGLHSRALAGCFTARPRRCKAARAAVRTGFPPARNAGGPPASSKKSSACLFWLAPDTRALAVKDLRMFWRDTTQWGQSVMLFGLLGVYIINLRNFTHQLTSPFWINLVAFLNLGICSLNLASVTTRFVFPQFSLEGWRLWIIGMAPMGMARVVKTKFWLASILSLSVTLRLITLSCYLLRMTWDRVLFFAAVITVMTFALNGLAIGLGVLYPNLKEANPNKIVSGFGGTLCFVLSSLYILASVLLLMFGAAGLHGHESWAVEGISGFVLLSVASAGCR